MNEDDGRKATPLCLAMGPIVKACEPRQDGRDIMTKIAEAVYRDGFQDGQDHGNMQYKYPPEEVAWIRYKRERESTFGPLTPQEASLLVEWQDCRSYEKLTDEKVWRLAITKCAHDPREMNGQPIGMYHCPECGEMVIAGYPHPDYDSLSKVGTKP
jgi:hypothetical protein